MSAECDLVALREFVPAATAPLPVKDTDRDVTVCSLLPGAVPALVRNDGSVWLGLQVQHSYGDPSRDLAAVLTKALAAEPGAAVGLTEDPGEGPRLADLIDDVPWRITVHDGFDYWVDDAEDADAVTAVLAEANASIAPTVRLDVAGAAYWTRLGEREYLRWVRPEPEDALLDALARLHHAGSTRLVDGDRLLGMFRAHGLLVPVWEVPPGTGAADLAAPLAALDERLAAALGDPTPLSAQERSTRAGLTSRQVTLR